MRKEKGIKGQAALEYLMTYGWALAVIVVTVGVLIFMGILKPPSAAACTGLEKLSYDDHTIDYNGNFALYLKNGTGARITDVNAIALDDFNGICTVSPTAVNATRDFNIICLGTGVIPGQAYKGKIKIEYMRGRYARHEESAICTGNVPVSGALITIALSYFMQSSWYDSNYSSGSDVNSDGNGFLVLEGLPGSYSSFGSVVSNIFDAGETMDWTSTIEWDEETPAGTDINLQTRTSDNNVSWSSWSGYYTSSPSPITSPNGRFIQYMANLSSTNPNATPRILEVRLHGTPVAESCGNLVREGSEQCDTNDLNGETCISQGYVSGTLGCSGSCTFDTGSCNSSLQNQAPVSILSSSTGSALVGTYITFYGNLSYDADGTISSYDWNFGDGNAVAGESAVMQHKYNSAGSYDVTLTVTDNNSASDSNSVSVNISSAPVSLCPKTWTTQSDWNSGTDVNLDLSSYPGSIAMQSGKYSGTWNVQYNSNSPETNWGYIDWGEDNQYGEELDSNISNLKALWHMNEGSGTLADSSGNGRDGTAYGSITYGAGGRFNTALQFDGSNDYVDVIYNFPYSNEFSVELWMKPASTGGDLDFVIGTEIGGATAGGWTLYWDNPAGSGKFSWGAGCGSGNWTWSTSTSAYSINQWHHVVGVFTGSEGRIYVDGQLDKIFARTCTITAGTNLRIGGYTTSPIRWYSGLVDEVAIYNTALSFSDINQRYLRGSSNIRLHTRSASAQEGLAAAAWSAWYAKAANTTSPNNQWIEVQAELKRESLVYTPLLYEISIYCTNLNEPPVSMLSASAYSANAGQYITFYGNSSYDSDGTIATYDWNFGDGNIVSSGGADMVHSYAGAGNYTVTLTVTDNNSASDSNSIGITATSGSFSKTWTTQADFNSASDVNIDISVSPGTLLLEENKTGLSAHWKFDEGSGATIYDSAGSNNGTIQVGTAWTTGKFGNALSFDGVDDWVNVPYSSALDLGASWTVSMWVKPSSAGCVSKTLSTRNGSGNAWEAGVVCGSYFIFEGYGSCGTGGARTTTGITPVQNIWYHYVATGNGATLKIYIDGIERHSSSLACSISAGNHELRMGKPGFYNEPYPGLLDEVRLYSRALSAGEAKRLYEINVAKYHPSGTWNAQYDAGATADWNMITWDVNLDSAELQLSAGLAALWHLNESSGSVIDSSGNGNNGAIANGTIQGANGKFSKAYDFDGVDDVVAVPNSASINLTGSATVEAWINIDACPSVAAHLVDKWNGGTMMGYWIWLGSTCIAGFSIGNVTTAGASGPALSLNKWYHVLGTYDGNYVRFYVNGILAGTSGFASNSLGSNTEQLRIGNNSNNMRQFNGRIDEAAIYNYALSDEQAWSHYARAVALRTKSAATQGGLAGASWSNWYGWSNSDINSSNNRWIEVQAALATADINYTPMLNDVAVTGTT